MTFIRFPFNWGAVPDTPSVATVATVADRWTNLSASAGGWAKSSARPHRFERIYTTPVNTFGQSVNFAYEVRDQFPFILENDSQVVLASTITNP